MIFHKQDIEGVYIIEPEPFRDERGIFRRNFCVAEFARNGLNSVVLNANISINKLRHTFRGFHYQVAPHQEAKTLTVIQGSIYNICVDLRPESPTYLQYRGYAFNAEGMMSIQVPAGCANSFLTLEDNTVVHYYVSEFYNKESERGIRYNDPIFGGISILPIDVDLANLIISNKDKSWPDYVKEAI